MIVWCRTCNTTPLPSQWKQRIRPECDVCKDHREHECRVVEAFLEPYHGIARMYSIGEVFANF